MYYIVIYLYSLVPDSRHIATGEPDNVIYVGGKPHGTGDCV